MRITLLILILIVSCSGGGATYETPTKVVIFLGQSNCASSYTSAISIHSNIVSYDLNPLAQGGWGVEDAVAQHLDPAEQWILIKYAVGGSIIKEFATAPFWIGEGGHLDKAIEAINDALPDYYSIVGCVWIQGESEAMNNLGSSYYSDLLSFIQSVRAEYGYIPFVITKLSAYRLSDVHAVREAQEQVHATVDNTTLIETDHFELQEDGIHYTYRGIIDLGAAIAAELNSQI